MCTCKNCGFVFDGSLANSELTVCPRCGMDADTFIEWVGVQQIDTDEVQCLWDASDAANSGQ